MKKRIRFIATVVCAAMALTALPSGALAADNGGGTTPAKATEFTPSAPGAGVDLGDGISWPLGQSLPSFKTPAEPLDAIRPIGDDYFAAIALAGIVNRKQPRIYLMGGAAEDDSSKWPQELGLKTQSVSSLEALVTKYRDEIKGLVVYTRTEPGPLGQISHTLNLASTYAGIYDCLPVTQAQADRLTKAPYNLEIKEDYTDYEKHKDLAVESTNEDKYKNRRAVYEYLGQHLWPLCNNRLLVNVNPDGHLGCRDLGVATKAAQTWLNPEYSQEKEILDNMFQDKQFVPNESYMFGWWENEPAGVEYMTTYGVTTYAADFYENSTVFAGMSRELDPPTVPAKPELKNKLYIALAISDGDNLQYHQHSMYSSNYWNHPSRTKEDRTIPVSFTSSPGMLDAGPQILNYYYKSATDYDYFLVGPSGLGYTVTEEWPSYLNGKVDSKFKPETYLKYTNTYFEKTGLNMATIWNHLYDFENLFGDLVPSAVGFAVQDPDIDYRNDVQPIYSTGKYQIPIIALGQKICYVPSTEAPTYLPSFMTDLAKRFQEKQSIGEEGPEFWMIQTSPWDGNSLDTFIGAANRIVNRYGDMVEFVRADHLFMLRSEYEGLPFNVALRADATASGADGEATADKAVDGSFGKDKGWASSNEGAKWLQLDLGDTYTLTRYTMKNAESGYFGAANNSKAWQFQVSQDGNSWRTVDTVTGNTDSVTYRILNKEVAARYVRVLIDDPGADGIARIQDLEVHGKVGGEPLEGLQYDANNHAYFYVGGEPVKNTWKTINGVKYYFGADGIGETGWFKVSGKWYFGNSNAEIQTGWFKDQGTWYFADGAGVMATGWKKMGSWFYFGTNGKMRTGWFQVGSKWYFADSAGKMKTGWYKVGSKWYYSESSGAMATGWKKLGSKWYYLGSDGKMRTGWYKVGKTWYYSDSSGKMKTGWFQVGKKWYFTNGSGAMKTGWLKTGGKWYWLNSSGAMQTGWKKLGSKWYWFDGSGKMLAGTSRKIGGKTYRFNSSGTCLNP